MAATTPTGRRTPMAVVIPPPMPSGPPGQFGAGGSGMVTGSSAPRAYRRSRAMAPATCAIRAIMTGGAGLGLHEGTQLFRPALE